MYGIAMNGMMDQRSASESYLEPKKVMMIPAKRQPSFGWGDAW